MKNLQKFVSIMEITKMMYDAKSDLEKELAYNKWIQTENDYQSNKQIDKEKINEMIQDLDDLILDNRKQNPKNSLDLPLSIDKTPDGKFVERAEIGDEGYAENIEFCLHTSICSHTGKISIQYYGEDDTFLSHKEILKAIKIENYIGKYGK
jgi:hypothetical protein